MERSATISMLSKSSRRDFVRRTEGIHAWSSATKQAHADSALRVAFGFHISEEGGHKRPGHHEKELDEEYAKWNRGCLIGDFSLETTPQSKLLRERLEGIFQEWRAPFALCIAGEIDSTFDPMDLAEFLLASWEGAILRMKVERGPAALDRFKKIVFQTILKE
jgi:Tetracyclin repressor-like, C-terminal domain